MHTARGGNPAVVGISQLKTESIIDVRKEADKLKIALPKFAGKDKKKDPALIDPSTAIKSAAIYVAFISDAPQKDLPKPVPTGKEFRTLVIAAYNGGPQRLIDMAKQLGKTPYDWEKIKDLPGATDKENRLRKAMRGYVETIADRLAP